MVDAAGALGPRARDQAGYRAELVSLAARAQHGPRRCARPALSTIATYDRHEVRRRLHRVARPLRAVARARPAAQGQKPVVVTSALPEGHGPPARSGRPGRGAPERLRRPGPGGQGPPRAGRGGLCSTRTRPPPLLEPSEGPARRSCAICHAPSTRSAELHAAHPRRHRRHRRAPVAASWWPRRLSQQGLRAETIDCRTVVITDDALGGASPLLAEIAPA